LQAQKLTARAASGADIEHHFVTMCQAFHLDETLARPIYYRDPFFDPHLKRVLVDNGKVVSVLTVIPTALRLSRGAVVPVAGIAGVGTPPNLRNVGYASILIRKTLEVLSPELNCPLAALVTDRPDYYRRFGFGTCSTRYYWTAPSRPFPASTKLGIELLTPAQTAAVSPAIHAVYEAATKDIPGTFIRTPQRWTAIETHTPGRRVAVWRNDDRIAGYVAFDTEPVNGQSMVSVHEIVSACDEGRRALVSYITSHQAGVDVRGEVSAREFDSLDLASVPGITSEALPGVMLHITDLAAVLAIVANTDGFAQPLRESASGLTIRIDTSATKRASHPVRLFALKDAAGVDRVGMAPADELVDDWIAGDIESLTMLICGFMSAQSLRANGRLRVSSSTAVALADQLFPQTDPILSLPDMF
jgi:predicted acetyltransferase